MSNIRLKDHTWDAANVYDSALGKTQAAINAEGGSSITVDSALSSSSENPVQNKVVKAAIDEKYTKPQTNIPKTDLASDVQTTLGIVDNIKNLAFLEYEVVEPSVGG